MSFASTVVLKGSDVNLSSARLAQALDQKTATAPKAKVAQ